LGILSLVSFQQDHQDHEQQSRHQTSETIDRNRAIGSAQSTTSARVSDQRFVDGTETEDFMSVLLKQAFQNQPRRGVQTTGERGRVAPRRV
jgi:hypothetical protein